MTCAQCSGAGRSSCVSGWPAVGSAQWLPDGRGRACWFGVNCVARAGSARRPAQHPTDCAAVGQAQSVLSGIDRNTTHRPMPPSTHRVPSLAIQASSPQRSRRRPGARPASRAKARRAVAPLPQRPPPSRLPLAQNPSSTSLPRVRCDSSAAYAAQVIHGSAVVVLAQRRAQHAALHHPSDTVEQVMLGDRVIGGGQRAGEHQRPVQHPPLVQNPSSTSLPRVRCDSSAACARRRLSTVMRP